MIHWTEDEPYITSMFGTELFVMRHNDSMYIGTRKSWAERDPDDGPQPFGEEGNSVVQVTDEQARFYANQILSLLDDES